MGKIKPVIMGDIEAEEAARKKAEAKREQKTLRQAQGKKVQPDSIAIGPTLKSESVEIRNQSVKSQSPKSDVEKSREILKMMEEEQETKKADKDETDETKVVSSETKGKKKPKDETKIVGSEKKEKEPAKKSAESGTNLPKSIAKHGKKYTAAIALVDKSKAYPLAEAIELVKKTSFSAFDGSVEAHFNVSAKGLRGTVQLPHGTGKTVRIKIADDQLISELVNSGKIDFDILVAAPSMMPKLAKVAKILGPRGLMPNPKTGTIGDDTERLALNLSKGQFNWKTEPDFPIVHTVLGKVSFESKKIEENFAALQKSIGKMNIKSVFLKPTMGPSVKVGI